MSSYENVMEYEKTVNRLYPLLTRVLDALHVIWCVE